MSDAKICDRCGQTIKFCDYGCICPSNEEVYQCAMYMHYHPDEVNKFNKAMEEWAKQKGSEDDD